MNIFQKFVKKIFQPVQPPKGKWIGSTYYPLESNKQGIISAKPSGFWIGKCYCTLKENVICPHCQEKGQVYSGSGQEKQGISGGKATAALLTGGISLLGTGLSRNGMVTKAFCKNCEMKWQI
jgi:hypothetical protein